MKHLNRDGRPFAVAICVFFCFLLSTQFGCGSSDLTNPSSGADQTGKVSSQSGNQSSQSGEAKETFSIPDNPFRKNVELYEHVEILPKDLLKDGKVGKETIVLPNRNPTLDKLEAGSVILSRYKDGIFQKVKSVDRSRDKVVLKVEKAKLTDAVASGDFYFGPTEPIKFDNGETYKPPAAFRTETIKKRMQQQREGLQTRRQKLFGVNIDEKINEEITEFSIDRDFKMPINRQLEGLETDLGALGPYSLSDYIEFTKAKMDAELGVKFRTRICDDEQCSDDKKKFPMPPQFKRTSLELIGQLNSEARLRYHAPPLIIPDRDGNNQPDWLQTDKQNFVRQYLFSTDEENNPLLNGENIGLSGLTAELFEGAEMLPGVKVRFDLNVYLAFGLQSRYPMDVETGYTFNAKGDTLGGFKSDNLFDEGIEAIQPSFSNIKTQWHGLTWHSRPSTDITTALAGSMFRGRVRLVPELKVELTGGLEGHASVEPSTVSFKIQQNINEPQEGQCPTNAHVNFSSKAGINFESFGITGGDNPIDIPLYLGWNKTFFDKRLYNYKNQLRIFDTCSANFAPSPDSSKSVPGEKCTPTPPPSPPIIRIPAREPEPTPTITVNPNRPEVYLLVDQSGSMSWEATDTYSCSGSVFPFDEDDTQEEKEKECNNNDPPDDRGPVCEEHLDHAIETSNDGKCPAEPFIDQASGHPNSETRWYQVREAIKDISEDFSPHVEVVGFGQYPAAFGHNNLPASEPEQPLDPTLARRCGKRGGDFYLRHTGFSDGYGFGLDWINSNLPETAPQYGETPIPEAVNKILTDSSVPEQWGDVRSAENTGRFAILLTDGIPDPCWRDPNSEGFLGSTDRTHDTGKQVDCLGNDNVGHCTWEDEPNICYPEKIGDPGTIYDSMDEIYEFPRDENGIEHCNIETGDGDIDGMIDNIDELHPDCDPVTDYYHCNTSYSNLNYKASTSQQLKKLHNAGIPVGVVGAFITGDLYNKHQEFNGSNMLQVMGAYGRGKDPGSVDGQAWTPASDVSELTEAFKQRALNNLSYEIELASLKKQLGGEYWCEEDDFCADSSSQLKDIDPSNLKIVLKQGDTEHTFTDSDLWEVQASSPTSPSETLTMKGNLKDRYTQMYRDSLGLGGGPTSDEQIEVQVSHQGQDSITEPTLRGFTSDDLCPGLPMLHPGDQDDDGIPDKHDACPFNPQNILDGATKTPGDCTQGDAACFDSIQTEAPCEKDKDSDGIPDQHAFSGSPEPCDLASAGLNSACPAATGAPENNCSCFDNCPRTPNPQQIDSDSDGFGDACDPAPLDSTNPGPVPSSYDPTMYDSDADNVVNAADNCLYVPNEEQTNADSDSYGNVCDIDIDNDGWGNQCDSDMDGDGENNAQDSCPKHADDDICEANSIDSIPDRISGDRDDMCVGRSTLEEEYAICHRQTCATKGTETLRICATWWNNTDLDLEVDAPLPPSREDDYATIGWQNWGTKACGKYDFQNCTGECQTEPPHVECVHWVTAPGRINKPQLGKYTVRVVHNDARASTPVEVSVENRDETTRIERISSSGTPQSSSSEPDRSGDRLKFTSTGGNEMPKDEGETKEYQFRIETSSESEVGAGYWRPYDPDNDRSGEVPSDSNWENRCIQKSNPEWVRVHVLEDEPGDYMGDNDPLGFELDALYVSKSLAGVGEFVDATEAYVYEERLLYQDEYGSRQDVRDALQNDSDGCIPNEDPEPGVGNGCPGSSRGPRSIGNQNGTPVGRKLTGAELEKLNSEETNYGDEQCEVECDPGVSDLLDNVDDCRCDTDNPNPKCHRWKNWTSKGITVRLDNWKNDPSPKSYWKKRGIESPQTSSDPIVKTIEIKLEEEIPGPNSEIRVETPFGESTDGTGTCKSSGSYTVSVGDGNTAPKSNGTTGDPVLPPEGLLEAHPFSQMDESCNPELIKPGYHSVENRELPIKSCSDIKRFQKEIQREKKAQISPTEKVFLDCNEHRSEIRERWEKIQSGTCWPFDE